MIANDNLVESKEFRSEAAAKQWKDKRGKRYLNRLIDYKVDDILLIRDDEDKVIGTKVKKGAIPIEKGWLVS